MFCLFKKSSRSIIYQKFEQNTHSAQLFTMYLLRFFGKLLEQHVDDTLANIVSGILSDQMKNDDDVWTNGEDTVVVVLKRLCCKEELGV